METTHWADWADTFKLQDAACLIAGVSPAKEMVAWADKLPPEARPAFKKLWDSYMQGAGVYKQADFQKMLHGIGGNDFEAPIIVPARGMIRRQNMLIAPSEELMHKRLESVRVSRDELHRWVKAMGIKSAYSFAPGGTLEQVPLDDSRSGVQAPTVEPASDGYALPTFIHTTKTRRDALTPAIELAQSHCRNATDTAEVWAALLVLAEKKTAPLIGATEDGLQYLKNGTAASFNRDALRKRLGR